MEFPFLTPPLAEALRGFSPLLPLLSSYPHLDFGSPLSRSCLTTLLSPSLTSKSSPGQVSHHPNPSCRTESLLSRRREPHKMLYSLWSSEREVWPGQLMSSLSKANKPHAKGHISKECPGARCSLHPWLLYNSCFLVPSFSAGCIS